LKELGYKGYEEEAGNGSNKTLEELKGESFWGSLAFDRRSNKTLEELKGL